MKIRLEFKLQDLWIGAYWHRTELRGKSNIFEFGAFDVEWQRNLQAQYDLWICLVPCLPIHLTWTV